MRSEKQLLHEVDALRRQVIDLERLKHENKRIEATLRKSEQEKTAILDAMFEFVVLVNRDLEILWTNKAVNRELDLSPEQIQHRYCYELFKQSNEPCKGCAALRAMNAGHPITSENRFARGRILDAHYYPFAAENKILSVYTDITQRKLVELALLEERNQKDALLADFKASEEKYKMVFEDSRDSILIVTKKGRIIDANQACLDLFGIRKEDFDSINILDHIYTPEVIKNFVREVEKKRSIADYSVRMKREDGTVIDCLLTSSVKYAHDGSILGYQGVIRDITEKKKLEKQVVEISGQEQREIGQELHDGLGQLLTAIALKSKSIEQSLSKKSLPEAESISKITELANEAITQTRRLIKGLVPTSMEAGGLLAALEDMAATTSLSYGVSCEFHSESHDLNCDSITANQIYRIAQEATVNAAKHAKAGHVAITLDRTDKGMLLSVKDDGIGFSPDKKQHVGFGLQIMAYRARMIDAVLQIRKNKNKGGMTLTCMVPVKANRA